MSKPVGIDLGTTNSAIAYRDQNGKVIMIPNAEGKAITPSVICFRDGEIIVGDEAKELQASGEGDVAAFFKRQMGIPNYVFYAGGREYSATELSSIILKKLKEDAEKYLGESVKDAVITVPAYFRDPQRKATIEAGKMAGLNVLQVINEPTAAAIAYGVKGKMREGSILVYDLGGGTFDVTLMKLSGDEIKIVNSLGDYELGGKDWDEKVVEYAASRFRDEYNEDPLDDIETMNELLVKAEELKKRLTTVNSVNYLLVYNGNMGKYPIDRALFEEITSHLMETTISLCSKAIDDVNVKRNEIDEVLLVGGSTRMKMVHDFIREYFGKDPLVGVNVDEAVAAGAALAAAERQIQINEKKPMFMLPGQRKIVDVTNHSLGMIALNHDNTAYINSIILPKNIEIPCRQSRPYRFQQRKSGTGKLEAFMTQGEMEKPDEVTYLGKYMFHNIPYDKNGTIIDIEYSYDISGTVSVAGKARKSGHKINVTVESVPDDVPSRFMKSPEEMKENQSITVYVSVDLSGSMSGSPMAEAKKAALGFLENLDLCNSSVGVIAFSDHVQVVLNASRNASNIKNAINSLTVCQTGCGNATHPFNDTFDLLSGKEGIKYLIVLTDGCWSNQSAAINAAVRCHKSDINVIAVGFGGADEAFLKQIASSKEDGIFTSLDNLTDTFSSIAQVMTETGGNLSMLSGSGDGKKKSLFSFLKF